MKYIVTGGAGFIGANYIRFLLDNSATDEVVCIDALTYAGNLKNLQGIEATGRYTFIREDIGNREGIFHVIEVEKPDVVVNFAAETHVDRSILDPGVFLRTNIIGTQVLMDACLAFKVPRFHQVSTDEVYGDLPLDRPDLLFTEQTNIRASSPYSASKASADLLALSYFRTFGLQVTVSRCSNNYGPYQFPEKLIPLMISRADADQPLPVYGKGENVRDWIHVLDHCKAVDRIVREGKPGEVYNVGGNSEETNLNVVKTILRVMGKPQSLITFVTDRPGHDQRYAIDFSKLRNELGWSPEASFDEGIRETVQWYLDNRAWWEEILSGEYQNYYENMYAKR